jgi:hypothetical protein
MSDEITLTFKLPTDEEAQAAVGQLIQRSGLAAENQISLRAWFTTLLQDAGRLQLDTAAPEDGEQAEAH